MKKVTMVITLLAISVMVASPFAVNAAGKKAKSEVVMKMGTKVHLFHSRDVTVQKDIAIGDVLTVYRTSGKLPPKEAGQVKVNGFIDEHYFEAEIVKGDVKVGDIAKKENTSLLVQPAR